MTRVAFHMDWRVGVMWIVVALFTCSCGASAASGFTDPAKFRVLIEESEREKLPISIPREIVLFPEREAAESPWRRVDGLELNDRAEHMTLLWTYGNHDSPRLDGDVDEERERICILFGIRDVVVVFEGVRNEDVISGMLVDEGREVSIAAAFGLVKN